MKNILGIVAGDPISINSEIIAKTWKKRSQFKNLKIFIIGSLNLLKEQLKVQNIKIKLKKINSLKFKHSNNDLLVYDIPIKFEKPYHISRTNRSSYVLNCLNKAIRLSKERKIIGFINCSINKNEIFRNKKFGVTEFLGNKLNISGEEGMLIYNKNLSVLPLTTHISLKNVSKSISKENIVKKVMLINKFYMKFFKIKPKIGVLGLNPHNDEFTQNSEEKKIIIPAINKVKKKRINVHGPLSADTAFLKLKENNYDVLVGMYHDQVLSPFKALFKFDAINITIGLPFLRISPDHGTGKDILMKKKANPQSLIESIKFFKKYVEI